MNMMKFSTYRLGDVAKFINGRAYLMPEMQSSGKYRIVRVGNFTGKDEWYYSDMELDSDKYCETGDLLFKWACTFGPEIWDGEKAIFHYHIWKIEVDNVHITKDYLYYLLKFMTPFWLKATNGSTMIHITKETMEDRLIKIPISLETQNSIVEKLKSIDLKISNNNAIISELEAMAKDIYDYWFVQFDFPDENGKPYKSSGGKMVWNEELKREIPEGWNVTKIGSVTELSRGISYNSGDISDNGIPMINLGSFSPDSIYKPQNIKYYNGRIKDESNLKKHDLLICTTQQTSIDNKTDIIGKTIMIPDIFTGNVVASMDLVKVSAMQEMIPVIASETKTPWYNKYITGFASGTSILHLNLSGFMDYKIPLPNNTYLLKKFSDFFYTFEDMKSKSMLENQELTSLRDFLLPLLMNGQVKVGDTKA